MSPIIAKRPEQKEFTPCPEGLHHAVCVDVVDVGIVQSNWGDKYKVRLVWQVEEVNPETERRFDVRKQYTLSLHEKANLRKDLEGWRGRKFTEEELNGFDLENLIGINCQVQVVHNISDQDRVFANVQAVVPAPKGATPLTAQEFTRQKDRPQDAGGELTVEDIPFGWMLPLLLTVGLSGIIG